MASGEFVDGSHLAMTGTSCSEFVIGNGRLRDNERNHVVIVMDGKVFALEDREDVELLVRALRHQADMAWPKGGIQ